MSKYAAWSNVIMLIVIFRFLERHLEEFYVCSLQFCREEQRGFCCQSDLVDHINHFHPGFAPYRCHKCGRNFRSEGLLHVHTQANRKEAVCTNKDEATTICLYCRNPVSIVRDVGLLIANVK